MHPGIPLRSDYDGDDLRLLARQSDDADQVRRLLVLASVYDGGSREHAEKTGRVGVQIVRDRVVRFNEQGPDGLIDRKAPGRGPILKDDQRAALARAVEAGPKPPIDGVVRWRLDDLVLWLQEEHGVSVSRQTLGRELGAMGFRKLSARPRHYAQDAEAMDVFKKTSPPKWRKSAPSTPVAST